MKATTPLLDDLLAAIRETSGHAEAAWAVAPVRLEGGSWADTYRVRLANAPGLEGELVARILPEPDSYEREMLVQQHVAKQGFPAPQVHLGSMPTGVFDRAWFLMDFDPGRRMVERASNIALVRSIFASVHNVPRMLARTMVAIHRVEVEPITTTLAFPRIVGPGLDWLYSRASALGSGPLVERAQRLLATRPRFQGAVLCHGDLHPLNILQSPGRDTIIDWTHAQYDDPLYDVAFTRLVLLMMPVPAPRAIRPFIAAMGRRQSRRFIEEYERASETVVDPGRLEWFTRLIVLRLYVEGAEWERAHPEDPGGGAAHAYIGLFRDYGF